MKPLFHCLVLLSCVVSAAEPPRIVGPAPPVDAARGLVRVNEHEIRHYSGKGGSGFQLALTDRWFTPTDDTIDKFVNYLLKVDRFGSMPNGRRLLIPGVTHKLMIIWSDVAQKR